MERKRGGMFGLSICVLSIEAFMFIIYFNLTTIVSDSYFFPQFTEEKTESLESKIT